jgi:hypothetical protein
MLYKRVLYIFLDEGGNFDFSPQGSRFFSISCVTTQRPFSFNRLIDSYKYECLEYGLPQEYFHCSEDNPHVRKRVFKIINESLNDFHIDSLIVEKSKTPNLLREEKTFYSTMLGHLLRDVINAQEKNSLQEIIVITDTLPINKKRHAVEKSIKKILTEMLPNDVRYRVLHHASRAHIGLQIADYCNWAIFRKWERNDLDYYKQIKPALKSEYNIFENVLKE